MEQNILIIGAGGVASYLLPVLLKALPKAAITIVDKDKLEEKNLDRQLFSPDQIDEFKATALIEFVDPEDKRGMLAVHEWFVAEMLIEADFVICVADNHAARNAALEYADAHGVNCYLGGNEYFDHEAFAYRPEWRGTKRDPRVRYPSIKTDKTGSPLRCTGELQESHPQLAIANFGCAAHIMHLIWVWEVWRRENLAVVRSDNLEEIMPSELCSSLFKLEANTHHV